MAIEFNGKWMQDAKTLGVVFEAAVNGIPVRCHITTEALQSIDSSYEKSRVELQFVANQEYFQEIACSLIEDGRVDNSDVLIGLAEVRKWQ